MYLFKEAILMKKVFCVAVVVMCITAVGVYAADLYVYPSKGQSPQQIEKDKAECYRWAVSQTGFDPAAPPRSSSPPPAQTAPEGGLLRGAATGAALGAIGGAIAGNAGKGAAIGAATGGLFGAIRRGQHNARQQEMNDQWARQQAAEYQRARQAYDRAYGACMKGRGYTVN